MTSGVTLPRWHEWRQEVEEDDELVLLDHELRSSTETGSLDSEENGKKIFTEIKKFPDTISIFSIDADDFLDLLSTHESVHDCGHF